jgi:AcrR family transcriptional regulator
LFARRGSAGTGLQAVAQASGLGKSSLFHHFDSKAQLYYEVIGRVLTRIEERLLRSATPECGPAERLDRWLDALVDSLAEQPTTAPLLLRSLFEDDEFAAANLPEGTAAESTLTRIIGAAQQILADGIESGEFREVSIPDTLQTLIGATVYHFASGDFGEGLMGGPIFSADAVRRRKREIREIVHQGLVAEPVR